jgi:hypothetical protein
LSVSIQTMSPSAVPVKGDLTLTGTITNRSNEAWTKLQVFLLTSPTPMTTTGQLAQAAASDPATEVGSRLTATGLYDEVGNLDPGASTDYRVTVNRKDLQITGDAGVYWVGVHVLGGDTLGRDNLADGRARTFIPLMPAHATPTTMSVLMPLRSRIVRGAAGRVENAGTVSRALGPDGRLERLLQMSGTSSGALTWIVEPSIVDAARSLAHGNPPRDIGPTDGTPAPSPPPGASPSPSPTSTGATASSRASPEARSAANWLRQLRRQSSSHAVMALPYGSLDVTAALDDGLQQLFRMAVHLSRKSMSDAGVSSRVIVAPPSGYISHKALSRIGPKKPVLLSDAVFPSSHHAVLEPSNNNASRPPVVLTDTASGSGGPAPGRRFSPLAVRQRILSEAAVHALSAHRGQPMVVSTPQFWNPGANWRASRFFSGLQVPWLDMVELPSMLSIAGSTAGTLPAAGTDQPAYPRAEQNAQLPFANLVASQELVRTGGIFSDLLAHNDTVDEQLAEQAMEASSTLVRRHPRPAMLRIQTTGRHIRHELGLVRIDGPPFVIMSSESGTFSVTVTNGLSQAVDVGIQAATGSAALTIHSTPPTVLGPGQRASVRLRATSRRIGVHVVTLVPVTTSGQPLGDVSQFSVRSSQVGKVIWTIMGVGAGVLVLMIGVRIRRRVSRRKTTHGPIQDTGA